MQFGTRVSGTGISPVVPPSWQNYIWQNQDINEPQFRFPFAMLAQGLAVLYGCSAWARRTLYRRGWLTPKRLPAPVISVGNITTGGTGKTPITAYFAKEFQERGHKVAILSRGYGGRRKGLTRLSDGDHIFYKPPEVGEEAYWLARVLPGAIVYTCPSRYEAGMAAWREHRPDLFLLDDGFQHFQLHREVDIVLLDAQTPLGNGRLLPAGPLREPLSTLKAADMLVLTRFDEARHQGRLQEFKAAWPEKPVLTAAVSPAGVRRYPGGEEAPLTALKARPLFAFAGIARPLVFQETLGKLGIDLKGRRMFADHHIFTELDLANLDKGAKAAGAEALVTTAKDWARLGERWPGQTPLWVLDVEARLQDGFSLMYERIFADFVS